AVPQVCPAGHVVRGTHTQVRPSALQVVPVGQVPHCKVLPHPLESGPQITFCAAQVVGTQPSDASEPPPPPASTTPPSGAWHFSVQRVPRKKFLALSRQSLSPHSRPR